MPARCCSSATSRFVGQIYNLSSRPANAFLLWWVGLAALPWLLRSAAQFALLLLGVGIWFGVEINDSTSLIRFDDYSTSTQITGSSTTTDNTRLTFNVKSIFYPSFGFYFTF